MVQFHCQTPPMNPDYLHNRKLTAAGIHAAADFWDHRDLPELLHTGEQLGTEEEDGEGQVQCVNVVIGVVLGELHVVVHVIPLVVCDDAVVRRTLVFIALYRSLCFHRSHFVYRFSCIGGKVFTPPVGDSRLPSNVTEFLTVLHQREF